MKVDENLKKNGFYLFVGLVVFLVLASLFQISNLKRTINFYEKEQKKLQQKINDLEKDYQAQGVKIVDYENRILVLDSKIQDNNNKINDLYENAKNKKNSFRSYDARMWERYFTDRYSEKK